MTPARVPPRRKVTRPRQAGSPRTLDRWALLLRRQGYHLRCALALQRELEGSVARSERR